MIKALDHLNIRTTRLDAMIAWYGDFLGMAPGPRPDFSFAGAWMYVNGLPLVHLVAVAQDPGSDPSDLRLEHGAFNATGFAAFVAKFDAAGLPREIFRVPGFPIVQVNVWDPDGNHLHIDFHADEVPDDAD